MLRKSYPCIFQSIQLLSRLNGRLLCVDYTDRNTHEAYAGVDVGCSWWAESGLRIGGNVSHQLTATFFVLNGWQNIIENNSNIALGTQIQYRPDDALLLNLSTLYGNEQLGSMLSQHRLWNNFYIYISLSQNMNVVIMDDNLRGKWYS